VVAPTAGRVRLLVGEDQIAHQGDVIAEVD
jgi:hypothetical protein